ncbi:MAG: ABC transporter permease [Actinomycetia bacterium]|nr:ABC transporter permease [Actinomycetes bacterium]
MLSFVLGGLQKTVALYLANLKATLRFVAVLLAVLLALIAVVLLSLPKQLFSAQDVPQVSLAVVYGDGNINDALVRNLNSQLSTIKFVKSVQMCSTDAAETLLATHQVDAAIYLPADTLDVLVYGGHATITVKSDDPFLGPVIYTVANSAVDTLDQLQGYSLLFRQGAQSFFSSYAELSDATDSFDMKLIGEAFTRTSNVDVPQTVSPYYAQALTLILFLTVSIACFYVAVVAARQYAGGYFRHLYTKRVRYRHLIASQLLLSASIALVLGLVLGLILQLVGEGPNILRLMLSAVLLSLLLCPVYLMFSGFRQQLQVATTRTLIGCLAVLFFLLFAGGGFYPTALMQSNIRIFNPSWLSNQLSVWSLGAPLDIMQLLLFLVPMAVACAVGYLEWRRSL